MLGWFRRSSPEEMERARCAQLARTGRRVEGLVTEVRAGTVFYQYEIRSVCYQAAQDLQLLGGAPPWDDEWSGPVTVQYDNQNPANSRVVLEEKRAPNSIENQEKKTMMKTIQKAVVALALVGALLTVPAVAANKPKTVIHVINVKFKADAKPADVEKAIEGIYSIVGKNKGVKNVWLKPIKVQGGAAKFTHCLVMEFESEKALADYAGSPEQLAWYKLWEPVRELSNTHDVTN
jgi:hypothetical protein